ncbi:hypothetical protein ABFX02_08G212100 [Erythranthe guttata]
MAPLLFSLSLSLSHSSLILFSLSSLSLLFPDLTQVSVLLLLSSHVPQSGLLDNSYFLSAIRNLKGFFFSFFFFFFFFFYCKL